MPGKVYTPTQKQIASSFSNNVDVGNGNVLSLPKKVSDLTETTKKLAKITRVSLLSIINAFTTVQDNILEQMSAYQYKPLIISESDEESKADTTYESAVDIAVATNKLIINTLLKWVEETAHLDIFKYIEIKRTNAETDINLKEQETEDNRKHVITLLTQACDLDKSIAELYQSFKELITVESELEEIRQSLIELLKWNREPEQKIRTFEETKEMNQWAKKAIDGSLILKDVTINSTKLQELNGISSSDIEFAKTSASTATTNALAAQAAVTTLSNDVTDLSSNVDDLSNNIDDVSTNVDNLTNALGSMEGDLAKKASTEMVNELVGDLNIFQLQDESKKANLSNLLVEVIDMIGTEPEYDFVPVFYTENSKAIEGVYSFDEKDKESIYYQITANKELLDLSLYYYNKDLKKYIPFTPKSVVYFNRSSKNANIKAMYNLDYYDVTYNLGEDEYDEVVAVYTLAPVVSGSGLKALTSVIQNTLLSSKTISADRFKVNLLQAGVNLEATGIVGMGAVALADVNKADIIGGVGGTQKPIVSGGGTGPIIVTPPKVGQL